MTNPVKTAVIGLGYWGPNLARSLEMTGEAEIAALCDQDETRLSLLKSRYPKARLTTDYVSLIADPEIHAVAIATPVSKHAEIAKLALKAGKHVLVEKPICLSSNEARFLHSLSQATQRVLMVGHVFEYNASLLALRDLIRDSYLGPIHYLNLERTNLGPVRTDVNALWDLATHDISIMLMLLNEWPETVQTSGGAYLNPGKEDVVFVRFTFPNGTLVNIHASWLNPRKVREVTAVGALRMAVWNDLDIQSPLRIYHKQVKSPQLTDQVPDTFVTHKTACVDSGLEIASVPTNEPLKAQCEHFLACIQGREVCRTDGARGLQVVTLLEKAEESLQNGGRVVRIDTMPARESRPKSPWHSLIRRQLADSSTLPRLD